jgi:hypothetical protein
MERYTYIVGLLSDWFQLFVRDDRFLSPRLGRVAVVVGRVAKVLECIVCTLGRAARSDKIVLGILDAIVYMYVMDCCYRRLSHYG